MADGKYRVERGDPLKDRERIVNLWERCDFAAGEQARGRYDWFYLNNPRGPGRVYLLVHVESGSLVGAMGAGSRRFARAGEPPINAAVLVDFVVLPAHRSMFPALQLQGAARELELREAEMVYGLPDVKAAPVFRRLGASLELRSCSNVRVLRSGKYARRLMPRAPAFAVRAMCWLVDRARLVLPWLVCRSQGVRVEWHPDIPESLDAFSLQAASAEMATGERSRQFLQWRFDPRAGGWQVASVWKRGRLVAYFIGRREAEELRILDLLFARREAGMVPLLSLVLAAWPLRVDAIRIEFGGSQRVQGKMWRAGFLPRDERPCFLMQAPGGAARPLPREWWLTRADEDV